MISAQKLTRRYHGGENVVALDDVSFEIWPKERISIVGRSGSGKTTLLNLLAGLDTATSGELNVAGHNVCQMDRRAMAAYRLTTVGVIFQSFQLLPQRTALQNVELPLIIAGVPTAERVKLSEQSLKSVGLSKRSGHFPWQMSGGEQQRIAIARALVNAPPVLLADEPTGNLDSVTSDEIVELMKQVCDDRNVTLVLVTHDDQLAASCCDRRLRMLDGRLMEEGAGS